jgi:RNA polymerase sigma-70 factor (ECF subfamily)
MDLATPAGFAAAYDRHAAEVLRAARGVLGDGQAAEDVTQDVFVSLWRRPERYDAGRGPLGPYLRLMARSRALDVRRTVAAAQRASERLERDPWPAAPSDDAHAATERADVRAALRAAVRRLPATQREAVALAYWGGLSTQELSDRVRIPVGTAKSRVRLGLRRLAEDLSLEVAAAA